MHLRVQHETRYSYETPPVSVIDLIRLTPRNSATQSVRDWRITVSGDAPLSRFDDAFGNICHTFTMAVPEDGLVITATGTVDTSGTSGVMAGTKETLPTAVFLRETALTERSEAIEDLARDAAAAAQPGTLNLAHTLMGLVHDRIEFDETATDAATAADAALSSGRGVCQDLTHVMLAAARAASIPARYVSGYQFQDGNARDAHAGHAWAELLIDDLGWVGFDPTAAICTDETYIRVAVGLDTTSASPVRGAAYGGSGEALEVTVLMDAGPRPPSRFQSQTMFRREDGSTVTDHPSGSPTGGSPPAFGGPQAGGGQTQSQSGQDRDPPLSDDQ
ncbi:MAG: transglutaminase family protein [Pseudomonadota bacterium]